MKKKKVTAIVGGTGGYTLLKGLSKYYKFLDISAICAMTDTGGSNRTLVYEFGTLPFSDIIQCMLALTPEEDQTNLTAKVMKHIFSHRFDKDPFKGERLGNAVYAALVDLFKNESEVIRFVQEELLKIRGRVLPVTLEKTNLVATYLNNHVVVGEHEIDMPEHVWQDSFPIVNLSLDPVVGANPAALEAIARADIVVVGPGDVYTSLLPNIIVPGVVDALRITHAKVVFPVNLMTKYGQTTRIPTVAGHVKALEDYLGKWVIDCCLVNEWPSDERPVIDNAMDIYKRAGAVPVRYDGNLDEMIEVVRTDLISNEMVEQIASDKVSRSYIRHDPDKLAEAIFGLL